ncbi:DUF3971 domain-containing protein [Frigidibacter sp. RF13]|uniref:YhdP family protein n=1 Tax=Frigidibacter sp. RF13 TaxID=2997340 RepID=UPI00226E3869|nr:DUF3971 domain-containing protein [Frigidibacter sp. RF13]MCY1127905.1 DUF3971 domain-containing protein [Frigidibacter sp. RF13]
MKEKRQEQGEEAVEQDPPRHRHLRFWATLGLSLWAVVAILVGLGLSGRSIPLPKLVVSAIETRANRALDGQAQLRIGDGDLVVTEGFVPQVRLGNVTLISARGQRLALISDLRTGLDRDALLSGRLQPSRIRIDGARIAVRRLADGTLDIAPGAANLGGEAIAPADLIDALDAAFAGPALSRLEDVTVGHVNILFDDRRAEQVWTVNDGHLTLRQGDEGLIANLAFALAGQSATSLGAIEERGSTPPKAEARAEMELTTDRASPAAALNVRLSGISARDLGRQVPALAWLAALDAPMSGTLGTGFDEAGDLRPLDVRLAVGAGALQPTPDTAPVAFRGATLDLTYDPARYRLSLNDLRIDGNVLQARFGGSAWLKGIEDGWPEALVAQIRLDDLRADPEGVFADPVSISQGAADLKLTFDPFRLTIGQLALSEGDRRISGKGEVSAEEDGWAVAFDVGINAIATEKLLALWPLGAVPKTRVWLAENVAAGDLYDVKAALRLRPGTEPRFALDYRFREAEVRFMRTLPPIVSGAGYATISDNAYVLVVERGQVHAPEGGDLDIAGSVLKVPDIRLKPSPIEITLKSDSTITAALSILDEPPLSLMSKAGQPVDLAEGRAELTSVLKFVPKPKLLVADVAFDVSGTLLDVDSDRVVPGHLLEGAALTIAADNEGMSIGGAARYDGIPVEGLWAQTFGPEAKGRSVVDGKIAITPDTLKRLSIALPDGAVKGEGWGTFHLDLAKDAATAFRLNSDLAGLTLAIPEVGWSKVAKTRGELKISGALGKPVRVDALSFDAGGLKAAGKITLGADGAFETARFPEVTLGDWFTGDVTLKGRGAGKSVGLTVSGGSADMRRATFGGSGGARGDRPPLEIALDQLRISSGLAITGFKGSFTAGGAGLSGAFAGLVNGRAPITGEVVPDPGGRSAFRVRSDDAGRAMAAAGIYESGRGGRLELTLRPVGVAGSYDGALGIRNIRIVGAPALAGLLNAISVVGLISELQGDGIIFTDVAGRFRLTPEAIEIQEGSAIGPSLGVSAAGLYWSGEGRFDLQGVISPLYLVNGIGQIFSRQRDGLFGFNYTLKGTRESFTVGVNPLSILTPGMFRNLFRKAPPSLPGAQSESPGG